jgi:hypothetical protein
MNDAENHYGASAAAPDLLGLVEQVQTYAMAHGLPAAEVATRLLALLSNNPPADDADAGGPPAAPSPPPLALPADSPLEMRQEEASRMIGWLLHLRRRFLYHQRSVELGADPSDVDGACLVELIQFARRDRVLGSLGLPSGAGVRALSDVLSGAQSDYFKRRKRGRPVLISRQQLLGLVAHYVETLIACGALGAMGAGKTAKRVADGLNAARLREPGGGLFTDTTVTDWHQLVVHGAKRGRLERHTFEALQAALKRDHPGYLQWSSERCFVWLRRAIRDAAKLGYFDRTEEQHADESAA